MWLSSLRSYLFLLVVAFLSTNSLAQLTYSTNNGGITITGYSGSDTSITIPDQINGWPVRAIGQLAFYFQPQIQSVTLPDSISDIGGSAFIYCFGLTNVCFGNQLTNIGGAAFAFSGIQSIVVPDSVVIIGGSAFESCNSLTNALLGKGLTTIQPWTFYHAAIQQIVIPAGITNIQDSAFAICQSLTNLSIGNSVITIGDSCFLSCLGLTHIDMGTSVTSIGTFSFAGCGIGSFYVPASVTNIAPAAFTYSAKLTSIVVDPENAYYESLAGVLFDKSGRTLEEFPNGLSGHYSIPAGVTNIQAHAFDGTSGISSVTIPASVEWIDDYAFNWCEQMTNVFFEGTPPILGGDHCFYDFKATAFYLSGSQGWGSSFGYLETSPWLPQAAITDGLFGVQSNQFGFTINWARGTTVVVEASSMASSTNWQPLATNILESGSIYFADPSWIMYPSRFYRIRSF